MLQSTKSGLALAAATLTFISAGSAFADPLPNLVNLDFTQYTGSAPKNNFTTVNPVGWQGGGGLIAIDSPTTGNQAADGTNGVLATYGNPIGLVPGNYVQADGNPDYEGSFSYTVTGLTPGKTYSLSFYQGASSQQGFGFNSVTGQNSGTTNQWIVSLGKDPLTVSKTGGPTDPQFGATGVYYNTDTSASVVASPLMTVPYQGTVGWNYVTVNLTADAETNLLSFLAWGDNGSTVNLPPIAFLAGINSPPGLGVDAPEPASLSVLALGVAGLYRAKRRKRAA